jgi:uncharacterized protein
MNWHGHYWTLRPVLQDALRPAGGPSGDPWSTTLEDPLVGRVRLTGLFVDDARSHELVVLVHGLGGSAERAYMQRGANAAASLGMASLRLSLRGADLSGDDIHHAGLVEDIAAVLQSPDAARFESIYLLGYSLGGHSCLRYAALGADPRVRAVVALGSPVDLSASAKAFDAAPFSVYRPWVLSALKKIYRATLERGVGKAPWREVRRVGHIRHWDDLVVAPRFGFASGAEYYRSVSVAPLLAELPVPSHYVGAALDPMVPRSAVDPFLPKPTRNLEVTWLERGGHIGFPPTLQVPRDSRLSQPPLGQPIEHSLLAWARSVRG